MAPQREALVLRDGRGRAGRLPGPHEGDRRSRLRRLADRRARQGRARRRQLRRGHRRRQVVHRQRARPGRGARRAPSWRRRDEGHAALGVRAEPVERPARRLRPARGPAAGAQDRLGLRLRRHRAGVGHRSLGQHQPARGHPAQPRQPRGLPRVPAPGQGAARLQHVLGPAGAGGGGRGLRVPLRRRTRPTTTRSSSGPEPFVDFLAGVGAEQLVVRPVGSAWMSPPLDVDGIKLIGERVEPRRRADLGRRHRARPALRLPRRRAHRGRAARPAGGDRPGHRRAGARHRGAHGRRHRPGGLLPRERRARHARPPQGHPLRRHRRGVPDARRRVDDAQGRRRTADRALVLRARHRGRPGRRPRLRRARCGSATTRGWVVVESDHGGNPAELAMLNSWYLQHELGVAK